MKYFISISLLLVHLFNMGGYMLVFDHFENSSGEIMVTRLDNEEYADNELIEVKVPLNLPYQASTSGFERYHGEIEMNGVHYNYVKRKVENDTLVLLCIPNNTKTEISNARETFFSLVNDLNQAPDSKSVPAPVKPFKLLAFEYFSVEPLNFELSYETMACAVASPTDDRIFSTYIGTALKPPRQMC